MFNLRMSGKTIKTLSIKDLFYCIVQIFFLFDSKKTDFKMASDAQSSVVAHTSFVICYVLARFVHESVQEMFTYFAQYFEINVKTGLVPIHIWSTCVQDC